MKKITKKILKKREKRLAKRLFKEKLEIWKEKIIIRDEYKCQKCKHVLIAGKRHVHHIIALQAVKRNYPELLEDINNGILLCGYCHKFSPSSPHQGGFAWCEWFKYTKKEQYEYLVSKLYEYRL